MSLSGTEVSKLVADKKVAVSKDIIIGQHLKDRISCEGSERSDIILWGPHSFFRKVSKNISKDKKVSFCRNCKNSYDKINDLI